MAIVPILSGSSIGQSLQVNVNMLGGVSMDNATGRYNGITVFTGSTMSAADARVYLSSSFAGENHTIVQALNKLKADQTAAGADGAANVIQLSDGSSGFTSDSGFKYASNTLEIETGITAAAASTYAVTGDFTVDSSTNINLDADGGDVVFKDGGTSQLKIEMDAATGPAIQLMVDSDDLVFNQYDGNAVLTLKDNRDVEVATDLKVGDDLSLTSDSSVFNMGAGNDFSITHSGGTGATMAIGADGLTVDSAGDITLDADGGDIFIHDGGVLQGSLTSNGGELIIKSGATTAASFNGANVTLAGTVGSGAITSTGAVQGSSLTDGSLTISGGDITGGVAATFSGAVQGGTITDGAASINGGNISGVGTYNGTGALTSAGVVSQNGNLAITASSNPGDFAQCPQFTLLGTDHTGSVSRFQIAVSGGILRVIHQHSHG